jgi:hypothetical protein
LPETAAAKAAAPKAGSSTATTRIQPKVPDQTPAAGTKPVAASEGESGGNGKLIAVVAVVVAAAAAWFLLS